MSTAQTVPGGEVLARSRSAKLRRGLVLLAMTVLVPGSAQVAAGSRRLGRVGLRTWFGLLLVAALTGLLAWLGRDLLVGLVTSRWVLYLLAGAVLVLGAGWVLLLINAWWIARPGEMGRARGVGFSVVAVLLAVSLAGGSAWAASALQASGQLVGTVFGGGGTVEAHHGRYNVLLIGGDAGDGREGLRADSVTVASVDAKTGRTVLFSLPRNLEDVPFPDSSPLKKLYPKGYGCPSHECMLSAIYPLGEQHKDLYPGVAYPGVKALTEGVEGATGLKINYFAMVDLYGFVELVDAVGGIRMDVNKRVPIGGGTSKVSGYIEPGKNQLLNGYQALWFARSRHGSSDYERMQRQKCVMAAMLHQLDPLTVATKFSQLAGATQQIIVTDVPSSEVNKLSGLALKARDLDLTSASFTPPLIQPGNADFALIRKVVADEIARSEALDKGGAPASTAPATTTSQRPASSAAPSSSKRGSSRPAASTAKSSSAPAAPSQQPVTEDLSTVCAAR
ncbi:MAG: LCP family protein [Actinomycetia bacterium]|nr:LCP family protein [Actinomycetes bacterium]